MTKNVFELSKSVPMLEDENFFIPPQHYQKYDKKTDPYGLKFEEYIDYDGSVIKELTSEDIDAFTNACKQDADDKKLSVIYEIQIPNCRIHTLPDSSIDDGFKLLAREYHWRKTRITEDGKLESAIVDHILNTDLIPE